MKSDPQTSPPSDAEEETGWVKDGVDVWSNLFTREACRRVYIENPEMSDLVEWWDLGDIVKGMQVDQFLSVLDEVGISKAIIPSTKMWSFKRKTLQYSIEVEEVAAVCRVAPGRLFGAFGVNPWEGMNAVRALEESVTQFGFVAAHVHAYGFALNLNAPEWYPIYAKCVELGIPVMMQVGHSAEFMPSAVAQPILVDDIALYFPDLKIVCCHMGWPWVEELIALAWKHPNVYIATTAHAPKYWDPKLIRFADSRGKDKVMFGTDWPVIRHDRAKRELMQLEFRPESLVKLLRDNALRVFDGLGRGELRQAANHA